MNFFNGEIANVHSAALLLGAAGLLSRLLGILRDRFLAGTFGAGRELDVYYAAFQIPDFMSVLFLFGAGSAAILPIFQEYLARDRDEARRLISELSLVFVVGAVIFSAAAALAAPFLVSFIAPGFGAEDRALTAALARIMLLSPILLGLSSIFSSVVQSFQRFLAFALAPILYNIGIIIGIFAFVPLWGVAGLAGGVILGATLHFLTQFITVRRLGFSPSTKLSFVSYEAKLRRFPEGVRRVIALSFPRVLSVSLSNLTLLIIVAIGSTLAAGSIAVMQLAYNLYFVPLGVFGTSYAIAIFPRISRAFIVRDAGEFFRELYLGIRTIFFWTAPSTIILIVLRAHIVRVALGAGEFGWEDTRLTAAALAAFSLAVVSGALLSLLIKGFYALENTWRPLWVNIGASAFSLFLALFLANALSQPSVLRDWAGAIFRVADLPEIGVLGLAAGFAAGTILNAVFLYVILRRLANRVFGVQEHFPAAVVLKIIFSALLGGVVAYGVRVSFSETLPLISFMQVLWQGAFSGLVGFGVYFGALYLLGNEDVRSFFAALRRRFFKVKTLPQVWDGETNIHQHRM